MTWHSYVPKLNNYMVWSLITLSLQPGFTGSDPALATSLLCTRLWARDVTSLDLAQLISKADILCMSPVVVVRAEKIQACVPQHRIHAGDIDVLNPHRQTRHTLTAAHS